ncbi:Bacterial hemolysins domain-containing protein [Dioscorea alata]|uniref:Bacterial hemolysins domain-containing protein n=1 Tax=Dioscorea alata TaxID=55571 RepID=A0ACB7VQI2_DIOAL|nr:Bacterial hemolysins domain-containing protein [Dioscorea alata]
MGAFLSICFCKCFGGGEERPAQILPAEEGLGDVTRFFEHKVSDLLEEFRTSSFCTDDFLNSIDECLKNNQYSAGLLFEAVNRFENGGHTSSVLMSLEKFKSQGNALPQTCIDKFKTEHEQLVSRIDELSKLVKDLDGKIRWVPYWKALVSGLYCAATVAFLMTSALLVIKSKHQVMGMKDFDPGHKALARLDDEISALLNESKSSLKGRKDTTVNQLNEANDKLNSIIAVMKQTSRATKELDDIKVRVHEQVEFYIKSVDENSGNDEEANKNMRTAMHGIKTEAECFETIVENLKKDLGPLRDDLRKVLKNVKNNRNEFVCRCCC